MGGWKAQRDAALHFAGVVLATCLAFVLQPSVPAGDDSADGWQEVLGGTARIAGTGDIVVPVPEGDFEFAFDYRLEPPTPDDTAAGGRQRGVAPGGKARPAGAWNAVLVRIAPKLAEVFLNGHWQVNCPRTAADWESRFAKAPFIRVPPIGLSGPVVLHDEGVAVEFRGLRVRSLIKGRPPQSANAAAAAFEPALPDLEWEDYEPVDDDGRPRSFRAIVLTHAGDGSGRTFVATQDGLIHSWRPGDARTRLFLDLHERVSWNDRAIEEGFLGLAFHPRFATTGEFFVCYTAAGEPHTTVVSRLRRSQADPERGDPATEERLLTIPKRHSNHNGGTLCFGPDGMLYVAVGDGGGQFDPDGNGQDLDDLFGTILRIDVDRRQSGLGYAIPPDNPFVATPGARGEIHAYGFRNVWRMAFDRADGRLWAADVGQLLCEEIDVVERGGNYGWSLMEGYRPHGRRVPPADVKLLPPVFAYDHPVGGSIVGGLVYRGSAVPTLVGHYLYADHVSGECFALEFDRSTGRAVGTKRIACGKLPVLSFGEDESGEVYALVSSRDGRSLHRLVATSAAVAAGTSSPSP